MSNVPEFPADISRAATAYLELMQQTKERIDALREMLTEEFFDSFPMRRAALESCYLQMRLITELIARACHTAHSNVPKANSKWFRKHVDADDIMDQLADINPEFYPVPEQQLRDEQGNLIGVKILESGFITREELSRLYSDCGNYLHIKSAKALRKHKPDPDEINKGALRLIEALAGIVRLLEWHTIVTIDPAVQFWVTMTDPPVLKLIRIKDASPEFLEQLRRQRNLIDRHGQTSRRPRGDRRT